MNQQNASGSANSGSGGGGGASRPAVLADLSTTQLDELERQFTEGDHGEWNTITASYGWSAQDAAAVWQWFGQEPAGAPSDEGQPGPQGAGTR